MKVLILKPSSLGDVVQALPLLRLLKRHHPDANGGERNTEERLRRVIQAYTHLKSCARLGRWPAS